MDAECGEVCICSRSITWSRLNGTSSGAKTTFVHHVKFHVHYRIDVKTRTKGKISV